MTALLSEFGGDVGAGGVTDTGQIATEAFRPVKGTQASGSVPDSESRRLLTIQSEVPIAAVALSALRYVFTSWTLVPCRRRADVLGFFELSTFVTSDVALIRPRVDEFSFCSLTHMSCSLAHTNL